MALERLGRYEITGELGRGAMGVVYRATDPTIGRTVALKTMRVDVHSLDSDEQLRRFKNEARAAGALNHPNIVTIFDAGEQDGIFYIAMECIEGPTLQQRLGNPGTLPLEEMIDITAQVCAGLDYAHQRGVVHRDIKPSNIMVTSTGAAKITDFGVAKLGTGMTRTGQVVGTPDYMSPEQVKGLRLDGRSDLFSVGVMLYEMVTGERPFIGQNVTTVIYKIVNEEPIPPRQLDASVHPGLSAVITKALAKSPDERYQTGAELASGLRNHRTIELPGTRQTVVEKAGMPTVVLAGENQMATTKLPATQALPLTAPAPLPSVAQPPVVAGTMAAGTAPVEQQAIATTPPPLNKPSRSMSATIWGILLGLLVLGLAAGGLGYRHRQQRLAAVQAPPPPAPTQAIQQSAAPAPQPTPAPAPEAEKPKPVVHTTGSLNLSSSPAGATVRIDGPTAPNWTTPFVAKNLPHGKHTLIFEKNGFTSQTRSVDVVSGTAVGVNVELTANTATFVVTSTPPGATIFIDGVNSGKLTPSQVTVDPGEHKIAIFKLGYKRAHSLAEVGPGQTLRFNATLTPGNGADREGTGTRQEKVAALKDYLAHANGQNSGMLVVRTYPQGAEVRVGDKTLPRTTPFRFPLPTGRYMLTITLDGYRPVTRTVDVQAGKMVQVEETLLPRRR